MDNYRIGVFDSGFGGLEVLREIVAQLPKYDYLYLGDTARAPYGSRSQHLIYQFTEQAIDYLFSQGCWLIILACNTASSEALRKIQQEYLLQRYPKRRVLGVVIPAAEAAVEASNNNRIGVMATEATVASKAFKREIQKLRPEAEVFQQACPLLVSIVEAGQTHSEISRLAIRDCLTPLIEKGIDTLILGCTHYGLLEQEIREAAPGIRLVSEGRIVAQKLAEYLKRHPEIETRLGQGHSIRFLTTDLTDKFATLGSQFFGKKITPEKVCLG